MTTLIFLDDERYPKDVTWMDVDYSQFRDVRIVRTYNQFCDFISNCNIHDVVISFDHDLQDFNSDGKEWTGYDCLKYLVDLCLDVEWKIPVCYFHTQNVVGKKNMESYYQNAPKFQKENK